jgi:hypothetical protein
VEFAEGSDEWWVHPDDGTVDGFADPKIGRTLSNKLFCKQDGWVVPGIRTSWYVIPESSRLRCITPTNGGCRYDVEMRANPVALRGMNHWLVLLVTTRLRYDEDRWRLGLHLRRSAFTGYRNRAMIWGFDVKLIEIKIRGSCDA